MPVPPMCVLCYTASSNAAIKDARLTPMLASDEPKDFAKRYTAAWGSQNPANVAEFYSPNGSLTVNDGAPAIGRGAITEVAKSFMNAFPDLRVMMDDLRTTANGLQYRWTLSGTNTGPGGTGNRVRISGYELWQIGSDGLIANSQGHFDSEDYARQLKGG